LIISGGIVMYNRYLITAIIVIVFSSASAENYLLNGGQDSKIKYKLIQKIEPTSETVTVDLTFVIPQSFNSPTYNQQIENFKASFTLDPSNTKNWTDKRGNKIVKYSWTKPRTVFNAEISFVSTNKVILDKIETNAAFPPPVLPAEFKDFLAESDQIQTTHPKIRAKAQDLVKGAKTQYDAVQKILSWIIDHMTYVLKPEEYDALYAYNSGKGNCQNYSHLAAALMRSVGIPVRIVNGITLKEPYDIDVGGMVLTMNMAQGRHSWIEVYFPDLGWMPFDPQQTELFVSNRFIRVEVGKDNNETMNDGLVRWTRQKGSTLMLAFEEVIESEFLHDKISLSGEKKPFGPRKLLLLPQVSAAFIPVERVKEEKPVTVDFEALRQKKFDKPFIYGNLEFPEGVNFAFNREAIESGPGVQELQKNFLVETAEYVTGKLEYCQIFILKHPMLLISVGLALQNFGGSGTIWVELREDVDGNPGPVAEKSKPISLQEITSKPGYFWIDFDFESQKLILTPDRYWINLAYNGYPILNWFYSYGKPVGPIDGTRYKNPQETSWDNTLGYEFNYRVTGLTPSN
jgi:hypothetical protein